MSRNAFPFYQGANVSDRFMARWRSMDHVGPARPYCEVWIRRGRMERSWHDNWPDPQFGQVFGKAITHQWYPDWTPIDGWTRLEGVHEVDLDQSFSNNGITTATITVDNVQWLPKTVSGRTFHVRERGYLWPWYGWRPPSRPGSNNQPNSWYERLPNAQILVRQGYGPDTAIKTFTGLIDTLDASLRPDRMVITARDFGSVLTDSYLFGWNKTKGLIDPISFVPANYNKFSWVKKASSQDKHRWVLIRDATDVVRICLRWAGFRQWEIETAGVNLETPVTYDKSHTLMDPINDMATALGYVFFVGEPTDGAVDPSDPNDLSIGFPVFRRPSVLVNERSLPIMITSSQTRPSSQLLTDLKPKHDNKDERYIIRVRGSMNKKVGRTVGGDTVKRVTFTYWPPWIKYMSGIIKQLTYYDIGTQSVLGFQTIQQCMVAVMLIAVQIALSRDTATAQTPGQPGFGLDSFAFVDDVATGISSRLYITNRKTVMTLGGDGSGTGASSQEGQLLWSSEIGGSLCDNPDFDHVVKDYNTAVSGGKVISWGPKGWD